MHARGMDSDKLSLIRDEDVTVQAGAALVSGHLSVPRQCRGTVIFVHGSGSSRHSPRNRYVAEELNKCGLATLLFDLLTTDEERDRTNVFDIALLASRLIAVTEWVTRQADLEQMPVGYFGASTGAGAALVAAADPRAHVAAVVSRGGRPDLAGRYLAQVVAPTMLIVGGDDEMVLALNREARTHLGGESELAVVAGATHLFEEPGALEEVAALACAWFSHHLRDGAGSGNGPAPAAAASGS